VRARVGRAGSRALLLEVPGVTASGLHELANRIHPATNVAAVVPGSESLLILFRATPDLDSLAKRLEEPATTTAERTTRTHHLSVSFAEQDAPDLEEFLHRTSTTREDFLRRLESLPLRARFLGFRAGFAYLDGWPAEWHVPRRPTSRQRVPGGSFACAGSMAGFYPEDSPGGWNLLGRTDAPLWDPWRDPPNLIAAGDEVRIEIAPELARITAPPKQPDGPVLEALADVVSAGQLTSITAATDFSRLVSGLAPGGPFDTEAAASANLAVGNSSTATVLECVLVGPDLLFRRAAVAAWRGTKTEITVDGQATDPLRIEVRTGSRVKIGPLRNGLRGWLAISGGIAGPPPRHRSVPHRLKTGEVLRGAGDETREPLFPRLDRRLDPLLHVIAGPHRIPADILEALESTEWTVTPAIDRTGLHLRAAQLPAPAADLVASTGELPSIGAQFGSVQWHPSGELVALGPDHPVTGGYLQPFTIVDADRWKLAQLRPGDRLRWEIADEPQIEDLEIPTSS
jgi:KipI family sensor histidine kinase inhibitor